MKTIYRSKHEGIDMLEECDTIVLLSSNFMD